MFYTFRDTYLFFIILLFLKTYSNEFYLVNYYNITVLNKLIIYNNLFITIYKLILFK